MSLPQDPQVTVVQLAVEDGLLRVAGADSVNPAWAGDATQVIDEIIGQLQQTAHTAYLLTWSGSKVPRGAVVGEHTITYTSHGVVTAGFGEEIGTFRRLVEFGGADGKLQQIVVFIN